MADNEARERIVALANKIVELLDGLVDCGAVGVGASTLKPRDVTGALKDLIEIYEDKKEQQRDLTVHIDGYDDAFSE